MSNIEGYQGFCNNERKHKIKAYNLNFQLIQCIVESELGTRYDSFRLFIRMYDALRAMQ